MSKRYIANEPNVLLNIDTFDYCTEAYCADDINMDYTETSERDATYIHAKYRELLYDIDPSDIQAIDKLRVQMLEELKSRGYNVNNKVQPIIN